MNGENRPLLTDYWVEFEKHSGEVQQDFRENYRSFETDLKSIPQVN